MKFPEDEEVYLNKGREAIERLRKIRSVHNGSYSKDIDIAINSLKAWDELLQYLDKVDQKVYPRTRGWIACIKQIYREHMEEDK